MNNSYIKLYFLDNAKLAFNEFDVTPQRPYYDRSYQNIGEAVELGLVSEIHCFGTMLAFKQAAENLASTKESKVFALYIHGELVAGGIYDYTFIDERLERICMGVEEDSHIAELWEKVEANNGWIRLSSPVKTTATDGEVKRRISVHAVCIKQDYAEMGTPVMSLVMVDSNFNYWDMNRYCTPAAASDILDKAGWVN